MLIPIASGMVWNVLMRIGCLDRLIHLLSQGRWRPNRECKLLRESGYCMGHLG